MSGAVARLCWKIRYVLDREQVAYYRIVELDIGVFWAHLDTINGEKHFDEFVITILLCFHLFVLFLFPSHVLIPFLFLLLNPVYQRTVKRGEDEERGDRQSMQNYEKAYTIPTNLIY